MTGAAQEPTDPVLGAERATARRPAAMTVLRVTVSGVLVAWILRRTELSAVAAAFRSADPLFLLGSVALNPLGYWMSVRRWRLLLADQGVRVSFGYLLKSFLVGVFFNNLLPSLRTRARVALVVGRNKTRLGGREFIIDTPALLAEVAVHCGYQVVLQQPMETYQRYDLHQRNSIDRETLLVLSAPD